MLACSRLPQQACATQLLFLHDSGQSMALFRLQSQCLPLLLCAAQDRRSTPAAALVTLRPPPATSGGRGFEEAQCRCQGQWDTAALCLAQPVPAGAGHVLPGPCRPASRTQARGEDDHLGHIACLGNSAVQRHNCLQSKACFYACAGSKCNLLRSAAACVICDALHTYASSVYNRSA